MAPIPGLMQGKRGTILGGANNRSIASGIAKACHAAGAEIVLTYQGDALKKRVEPLAAEIGVHLLGHRDVTDAANTVFDALSRGITGEVHHVDSGYHVLGMKRLDAPDVSLTKE